MCLRCSDTHTRHPDAVLPSCGDGEISQTSVFMQNFSHDGELQVLKGGFSLLLHVKSSIRTFVLRKIGV